MAIIRRSFGRIASVLAMSLTAASSAEATLLGGLTGYYNFDGTLVNRAGTLGGPGGLPSATYAGSGSLRFLVADAVPPSESQFPAGFGGLKGDAAYFSGDTPTLDHLIIPTLRLGQPGQSFTINMFVAIGEDASAGNSGNETLGGNGPSIFSNKPVAFIDSATSNVVGGSNQGFAYGIWSNLGDDLGINVSDGAGNTATVGATDMDFDRYTMFTLVYDAAASQLRRYQGGSLSNTVDMSPFGSFDSGNDLRLGGYPELTTSGSDTLWGSMDELGIWNRALTTAEISSIATYASFGLSLEDLVTGVVLPQSQFTGNSAANNLASTAGNWTVDPALWAATTEVIVANGTTASFSGANTGPAVFDSTFGSKVVRNVLVGASGTSTFVEMTGNAELIGDGNPQTRIGVDGSTVRWTMSGNSRIEHRGAGEETSRFMIGLPGSATTVVMNDSSELTTGPRVADPTFAVGYRRTQPTNNPGEPPRRGDDLFFGEGNNGPASTVDVTLNNDAFIWVVDVLYPGDSNNTLVNVTQNNNSEVIVGWDTRFLDDGHPATTGVNWTMNDNSRFLVGRDHGLGETGGSGFVNVTVNDNAYFYAGDRIVIGAGGGNINVTINDNGHMKVGGDSPTDVLLVDDTGESAPGGSPRAVDWILHMGGSANAQLNVNGGHVEIGRNAYVGRGGGSAVVNMSGGLFEVKGVGPIAVGLGNSPGGGVPSTVNWANNGGALLVGFDSGDNGVFNYQGGKVDVATDVLVGLDGDLSGSGGSGKLIVSGTAGPAEGLEVGRNLSFGGVILGGSLLAGSEGKGSFEAVAGLGTFKPVTVTGDVGIFSGDGLTGLATLDFAFEPGARPTPGATSLVYDVIQYGGVRVGTFDELDAGGLALRADRNGLDYSVLYDDANKKISVRVDFVFAPGDANYDGKVDALDLDIWKTNVGLSSATFAQGDWNGDSVVDGADFLLWQRNLGTMLTPPALVAGGAVPEPSTAVLMLSIGVVAARRRRSAA